MRLSFRTPALAAEFATTVSRCPAFCLIPGGWPRKDQLRRRSGAISSPLSSSSTMYAPRRRAFF
jgi:hypothetical protein